MGVNRIGKHHTDDVYLSLKDIARYLKSGGIAFLYCTKPSAPLRALSDRYVRDRLARLSADEVSAELDGLTKLGKVLRDIGETIVIEQDIDTLDVKAGTYDLQAFVFDYLLRAYYVPELSFDVNKLFNLDWYAPRNYHGVEAGLFRDYCERAGLNVLEQFEQFGSSTIIATK